MKKKLLSGFEQLRKKIKLNRAVFIPLLVIIILALIFYLSKGQFIVATINGQPVWRLTLIRELEKQGGKKVLDSLITKTLILQEAKKQKVSVTDEEVNKEISQIEETVKSQGQNLDQLLIAQGMTKNDLIEQIRTQKLVEKIVGKDIKITDEEIKNYFEENKSSFPKDKKLEEVEEDIKKQLEQEKLSEKIQTWIQSLRDAAKINYL